MTDVQSLLSSLVLIKNIRSKTAEMMKCSSEGMTTKHGEEGKEKKFLSELKLQLDTINTQMKELVRIHMFEINYYYNYLISYTSLRFF